MTKARRLNIFIVHSPTGAETKGGLKWGEAKESAHYAVNQAFQSLDHDGVFTVIIQSKDADEEDIVDLAKED